MTPDIFIVITILAASMVLLTTGWIPMEVTALLVLGAVAISGLLSPVEALAGFSNPAVVTVWAVFILSGGLTHTGVASVIGNMVLKIGGSRETSMILVIMATAGVLSAIMNNVAVAALMLPVVMDIARQTSISPSRLLMPLAFGCLLGGMTTQIGTPPNILATEFLRENHFTPFSFFDFTPIGLVVTITGVFFMAFVGRHLLPRRSRAEDPASYNPRDKDWQSRYDIEKRLFHAQVPNDSNLVGQSLATVKLGLILGWNVISITRDDNNIISPGPAESLRGEDLLTIEGHMENIETLKTLLNLKINAATQSFSEIFPAHLVFCEVRLSPSSPLAGKTVDEAAFFNNYHAKVLAVRANGDLKRSFLRDIILSGGESLLFAAKKEYLEEIETSRDFIDFRLADARILSETYNIKNKPIIIGIPEGGSPAGKTIVESKIGEIFGNRILGILRGDNTIILPGFLETLESGDRLITAVEPSVLQMLKGIAALKIYKDMPHPDIKSFLSEDAGLVEAILSPGATIEGKSLRQLNFREKYGLNVLAIQRRGNVYRSNLKNVTLAFGDAILLFGPFKNLQMLGSEPDFVVLTRIAQERYRTEKMKISILILAIILFTVIMGWVPIYIAAVVGAAFMILTGCLTMEEAYRQIEWKAVFLIAGMLPLGAALDQTGTAMLTAQWVISLVGPYGPGAIMFGLMSLTMLATCVIPIPAVVVLMAPIALNTATTMGISPHNLMMAISMAASASFITPISHPAKLMVMGPGGYNFGDYLKTGIPLTLVILAVLTIAVPFFWPLAP